MKIIRRQNKEVYTVIKRSKNCHAIVKVLNTYDTEKEAFNTLLEVIQGTKTEEDLLQEYKKEG
jgi:transcription termination factor Rho